MRLLFVSGIAAICVSISTWTPALAAQDCNAGEILKNNIQTYDSSLVTWLSYVNTYSQSVDKKDTGSLGIKYGDANMDFSDAQALSSKYAQSTDYNLAQSDRVSILSSYLPPERVQAFVECLNRRVSNIDIVVASGSEFKKIIQGTIKWHPVDTVEPVNGSVSRTVKLTLDNGEAITGDGEPIKPNKEVNFQVKRLSLEEPFTLAVSIDSRSSDLLTYPAKPKWVIQTVLLDAMTPVLQRSGHFGTSAATTAPPTCISPEKGGMLLPSTAHVQKTGGGEEWEKRTDVKISESNPMRICAIASSVGVGCTENKCYHKVQGDLSVMEAVIKPVQ